MTDAIEKDTSSNNNVGIGQRETLGPSTGTFQFCFSVSNVLPVVQPLFQVFLGHTIFERSEDICYFW